MKAPLAISAVLCILLTLVGQKAAGMMPPPGIPRPEGDVLSNLAETLAE